MDHTKGSTMKFGFLTIIGIGWVLFFGVASATLRGAEFFSRLPGFCTITPAYDVLRHSVLNRGKNREVATVQSPAIQPLQNLPFIDNTNGDINRDKEEDDDDDDTTNSNQTAVPQCIKKWPVRTAQLIDYCHPTISDLDRDGRKEIILFGMLDDQISGFIDIYRYNGSKFRKFPLFTTDSIKGIAITPPSVADVNHDGHGEFIVGLNNLEEFTGPDGQPFFKNSGAIHLIDHCKNVIWSRRLNDSAVIYCGQSIADINRDGFVEIVFIAESCGESLKKYCILGVLDHHGVLLWEKRIDSNPNEYLTDFKPLCITDLTGDGELEIILNRTLYSVNDQIDTITTSVYLFSASGDQLFTKQWQVQSKEGFILSGGVACGDINRDSKSEALFCLSRTDITTASMLRHFWRGFYSETDWSSNNQSPEPLNNAVLIPEPNIHQPPSSISTTSKSDVYCIQFQDTFSLRTIQSVSQTVARNISLGDINTDGCTDIVLTGFNRQPDSTGQVQNGVSVTVLSGSGNILLHTTLAYSDIGQACIGDITGDGRPDIIAGVDNWETRANEITALNDKGGIIRDFPKSMRPSAYPYAAHITPALADLDRDGLIELVSFDVSQEERDSYVYVWNLQRRLCSRSLQWPMYNHDAAHTGASDQAQSSFIKK
ncbi:MAG: VCBS repeat-containing protein [Chitinivibrionales bacterium]|nr:VCBS repeat-containing protein [Chitinivibrionales bacterium]